MPSPVLVSHLRRADFRPCALLSPLACERAATAFDWTRVRAAERVGAGAFGRVFRAEYRGRSVALKQLRVHAARSHCYWAELNAAHLRHRNVVRVLAASACAPPGGACSIVMEFAGKRDLQHVIYGSACPLPQARALRYAHDIAHGLHFVHAHGVVHLDIKPANVLVSAQDVCKITDFGCSVQLARPCDRAHAARVCGTYTHSAPELLRGGCAHPSADIYSFAVTLWQLLTREQPYAHELARECVVYAVVALELRPTLRLHEVFLNEVGGACAELLSACWSPCAADRPDAADVTEQLEQLRARVQ